MKTLTVSQARQSLPSLIDSVTKGERIRITRRGEVVAELAAPRKQRKKPNPLKGSVLWIADDFDAPMPELWDALK